MPSPNLVVALKPNLLEPLPSLSHLQLCFCGTRLEVVETDGGILLKPKKSIWDILGAYSQYGTPEEAKKEIDELRHQDE